MPKFREVTPREVTVVESSPSGGKEEDPEFLEVPSTWSSTVGRCVSVIPTLQKKTFKSLL